MPTDRAHVAGQTIGQDIPPMRIMTTDLRFPAVTQAEHDRVYTRLVQKLKGAPADGEDEGGAGDPEQDAGRMDMGVLRQLCLL